MASGWMSFESVSPFLLYLYYYLILLWPDSLTRMQTFISRKCGSSLVCSHKTQIFVSYIIYKRFILYLQIGMFSKNIIFLCRFVFNTSSIFNCSSFIKF